MERFGSILNIADGRTSQKFTHWAFVMNISTTKGSCTSWYSSMLREWAKSGFKSLHTVSYGFTTSPLEVSQHVHDADICK